MSDNQTNFLTIIVPYHIYIYCKTEYYFILLCYVSDKFLNTKNYFVILRNGKQNTVAYHFISPFGTFAKNTL